MHERGRAWLRRWAPEIGLAALACVIFLGCLGSLELWGKREQRAVAESIDTVDNGHWLVAEIQSRPRLEKPPLPRWVTAGLMLLTGHRDEWLMRLPAALSALGMVAIVYALGRRMGGRSLGLASGLALGSIIFFVVEMRQAGNDGPLAFFVSLAIYAAWRRLYGARCPEDDPRHIVGQSAPGADRGPRRWLLVMYAALGLGFLCKGPIAWLLVALAIVPYLLVTRSFRLGMRALFDVWGLVLLVALALSWPVPVLLHDPRALDVWMLEMGQKAGTAGITHHRWRGPLAFEWPAMTAPWSLIAGLALVLPLIRSARVPRPAVWLPWFWAVSNLVMFCFWTIAKPNYFLPCVPAVALLGGVGWLWLCDSARASGLVARVARRVIQGHWVVLILVAIATPVVVANRWPEFLGWAIFGALLVGSSVIASILCWRRGRYVGALGTLVTALAVLIPVGYGVIGARFNAINGHAALARRLQSILPREQRVVLFYRELDEGLWYYLSDKSLRPVPGSQPRYNGAMDLLDDFRNKRIIWNEEKRVRADAHKFAEWLQNERALSPYVLIKAAVFDRFAPELTGLVAPVFRESNLERNELMLLRIEGATSAASAEELSRSDADRTARR